jgi:hypothetical protein
VDLRALWGEHQKTPFPQECLSLAYQGTALVRLDAQIGALLTRSLRTDGRPRGLSAPQEAELRALRDQVQGVLRDLKLERAGRDYFIRLETLSSAVLGVKA